MLSVRTKYYTGFKLSEASIIFCGLGYNIELPENDLIDEKDETIYKEDFKKISNVDIDKYELDLNPTNKINSWNKSVQSWLKYQVFLRLINIENKVLKNKSVATLITFVISAIWHGFFPGYYLTYFQVYLIQQISKILEEKYDFFNRVKKGNAFIRYFLIFFMSFNITYFCYSFVALNLTDSIKLYKAFYFIPNIYTVVTYIYLVFIAGGKKRSKQTKENEENQKVK